MANFGRLLKDRVLGIFGSKNTAYTNTIGIGGSSQPVDNSATWNYGFPSKTMLPVDTTNPTQGGIPPNGKDMNGVLNSISAECYNSMNGILPNEWVAPSVWKSVDSSWNGYPSGAIVLYPTGNVSTKKKLYQSTANNNNDTPSMSSKWVELFPASKLTVYPKEQNINGNTNCWIRESPDGFIMQGGTCVTPINYSIYGFEVGLIKSYSSIQMGASATSVSSASIDYDNDPALEIAWYPASVYKITGEHNVKAYIPMPLSSVFFRIFRVDGRGDDPASIIWTSWGI